MALMIGFALSPAAARARAGEAPPPPARRLTLDEPNREKVVYDSGAAFGRASARVPVRGTTEPGAAVEARAVSGATGVTGWTEIGAASATGAFALELEVPKGLAWCTLEARLRDAPAVRGATTRPFAVGHVLAIWGQSEVEHGVDRDGMASPRGVEHDDRVYLAYHDRAVTGSGTAGLVTKWLTAADGHTSQMAEMANTLMRLDADARFAVAIQAKDGTHWTQVFEDGNGDRDRRDDRAVHDHVTSDGAHVGAALMSWFATPSRLGDRYGEDIIGYMFGVRLDGRPIDAMPGPDPATSPGIHTYTRKSGEIETRILHDAWFLYYDYAHTKWVPMGPHRFEPSKDLTNHKDRAGGGKESKAQNIEQCRESWRALVDNPAVAGRMAPIFVEPLAFANGEDGNGATPGGWGDWTHPADDTEDGLIEYFRQHAHAWGRAAGRTSFPQPVFDLAEREGTGAWIDLGSTAGAITTKAALRGEDDLPDDHDHWTQVVGFEFDGAPIHRAELVDDKVRVYPNSGSFGTDVLDRLRFSRGFSGGALFAGSTKDFVKNPNAGKDLDAGLYRRVPIIDFRLGDVEGVAVRPLILPATLATTPGGGSGSGSGGGGDRVSRVVTGDYASETGARTTQSPTITGTYSSEDGARTEGAPDA